MQHNKNSLTDLEYLAELGYEKAGDTGKDLQELRSKIRSRVFSYNNGWYFTFINLIIGAFLGLSVFFLFYRPVIIADSKTVSQKNKEEKTLPPAILNLDTVEVVSENFVNPTSTPKKLVTAVSKEISTDTVVTITSIPMTTLSTVPENITEDRIIYIPNASVIFLHDLKITNYSTLYFRRNKFVALNLNSGLDASFANKEEGNKNANLLMPQENYYLHQVISEAMNHFSKKQYSSCLHTLKIISEINPNDLNCRFYSGMCYYYKKDFASAIAQFNECISSPNNTFLNEAQYYKALSLLESGNKSEAQKLFKEIAREGSFYSEKAKQLLN